MPLLTFKRKFAPAVVNGLYPYLPSLDLQRRIRALNPNLLARIGESRLVWEIQRIASQSRLALPKKMTIRTGHRFKQGDTLIIYTNARQPSMMKLGQVEVEVAQDIHISRSMDICEVSIDGDPLYPGQISRLAKEDGFRSLEDFKQFFVPQNGDTFSGQIIRW